MAAPVNQRIFHVTRFDSLGSIVKEGLRAPSYWSADESLVAYYAQTIEDEGGEPVVLAIDLDQLQVFRAEALQADLPGVEEPITMALGMSEEAIHAAWEASDRDWAAGLQIVRSLRFAERIPASMLHFAEHRALIPLVDASGAACFDRIPAYMIEVADSGRTLWVNSGKDGSAIGRFSKDFGVDVHVTGAEQSAGAGECLWCTHAPGTIDDFARFRSEMKKHHGVDVPASAMRFDDDGSLSRRLRPTC